ncbi:hypothetical protein cypCar_00010188 [Cyprinus carpio]|nr:hypothetical protein cypCar_00010188 [Cyprinus carpio]
MADCASLLDEELSSFVFNYLTENSGSQVKVILHLFRGDNGSKEARKSSSVEVSSEMKMGWAALLPFTSPQASVVPQASGISWVLRRAGGGLYCGHVVIYQVEMMSAALAEHLLFHQFPLPLTPSYFCLMQLSLLSRVCGSAKDTSTASSLSFSYTETKAAESRALYGEEEVCSDRLDADFPDFDLSQLDASDFDSVNCLSELHWCNEHSDHSPASIQYSGGNPELFEEENAALLAALTDSLDGIVEDGVGGLSVFPSLGDDPEEGEEEEDDLLLDSEPLPGSLSPETEDPSLLKKLLLSPPNVPAGLDSHKDGSVYRHSSRSQHVKPVKPVLKKDKSSTQERKPRPVRPSGRLCTELHRHLTTAQEAEDEPSADTEEEEEEEDEEDKKRSCLCLPLTSKSNGDAQYANKPFEQTLSVELCGTAGLTPPTTPPNQWRTSSSTRQEKLSSLTKSLRACARAHITQAEQTELYAQLRRMGQTGDTDTKGGTQRAYGDHDYCLLGLGESCKMMAATLGSQCHVENKYQVIYIHNLPSSVTQSMLRKRFEAFGRPEDCKVVIKNEERCGVITLRPTQNGQTSRHRWDSLGPSGGSGSRRFGRKRYIDLDEAGPGPVKSKYDALDFDALLKEAQRSLHR